MFITSPSGKDYATRTKFPPLSGLWSGIRWKQMKLLMWLQNFLIKILCLEVDEFSSGDLTSVIVDKLLL